MRISGVEQDKETLNSILDYKRNVNINIKVAFIRYMACGWYREIELQKAFEMSPNEAKYYALFDHGLSMNQIAEYDRVSVHTVGATLQRARDKVKKVRGETQQLIIVKGKRENEATSIKEHAMQVVLTFVAEELGAKFVSGKYVFSLKGIDAVDAGDLKWMLDNVFRKVDIYGATNDAEVQKKANKLKEVYAAKVKDQPCKVGMSTVKYFLDQMFIPYEIIEE